MPRKLIAFHSALPPDAVIAALNREADKEQWTLLSLSGYKGDKPLLLKAGNGTFRLQKRPSPFRRNDFARRFYARFEPEPGGTRIEGYFDMPQWSKWFMRVWLGSVIALGVPIFTLTLLTMLTGSRYVNGDNWVGLAVPPALILFGTLMPKIGRYLGRKDEQFILQFIQNTLAARMEQP